MSVGRLVWRTTNSWRSYFPVNKAATNITRPSDPHCIHPRFPPPAFPIFLMVFWGSCCWLLSRNSHMYGCYGVGFPESRHGLFIRVTPKWSSQVGGPWNSRHSRYYESFHMMPPFQAKATKVFMPLVVNQTLNFRPPIAFRLAGKSLHGMSSINFAVCFFFITVEIKFNRKYCHGLGLCGGNIWNEKNGNTVEH